MEPDQKRFRFRDADGREYDVDQLLGVPPHVAIKILLDIDNFLTLYNFSMSSHKARDFMERYQVFQKWDAKWFGSDLEIRRRVVDRFNRCITIKNNFSLAEKERTFKLYYDLNQLSVIFSIEQEELSTFFDPLIRFIRNNGKDVRSTIERNYWYKGVVYLSRYTFTCDKDIELAQFLYTIFSFASDNEMRELYLEGGTVYGSTEQILAFHACLRIYTTHRGKIYLRDGDIVHRIIRARHLEDNFWQCYLDIVDALETGEKIFVDDGSDDSVRFINSCAVCSKAEKVTHMCDTCHSPMHSHCWISSKHEETCGKE
jgi:hypothetical protein